MTTLDALNNPDQTSKGDLIVGQGGGSRPAVLPVGANGTILTADSTQATGMKWAAAGGGGGVIQQVYTSRSDLLHVTSTIPYDDTIPQITEGDQVLALTITPTNASNFLYIQLSWNGTVGSGVATTALFQDSIADALAAVTTGGNIFTVPLTFRMVAGTTSPTTFQFRLGSQNPGPSNIYVNGNGGIPARVLGGVASTTLTIWEIAS